MFCQQRLSRQSAAQSLGYLRTLRAHGVVDSILHYVTKATLVAQLTYAAPAWWGFGFLSAADTTRLQSVYIYRRQCDFIDDIFRPCGRTVIFSQHYFLSTAGVRVSGSYSAENHTLGEESGEPPPPQNKNNNSNYNNI